jgi:CRP/FNR family transcriptional regulator
MEQMLSDPVKVELVRQSTRTVARGEHVFYIGDPSLALYIVRSGAIKIYCTTEGGKEQVLGFYLPGDVFGFDGAENEAHQSSAMVLEFASICTFPFASLSESGRGIGYPRLLSNQVSRDYRLIVLLAKSDAEGRVASFLCDLAGRFERNGYSPREFILSMSRQDIGNYLGLATESVSRALTRFQQRSIIEVDRRIITISNLEKLQHIAGTKH